MLLRILASCLLSDFLAVFHTRAPVSFAIAINKYSMRINEDFLDDAQRDDISLTTADAENPEYGGSYDIAIYIDL